MNATNKPTSIRKKLQKALLLVFLVTMIPTLILSEIGMVVLRNRSEEQLIDQAVNSATVFTAGQAETISAEMNGIVQRIEQAASYTEYLYQNPGLFTARTLKTPDDFSSDVTGNQLHWLPFIKGEEKDAAIVAEANLLSSLEPCFETLMAHCPTVVSLYAATVSHVNIGYDQNVLDKQGFGAYDPDAAGANWYKNALSTKQTVISDTYTDTFGRGLMVTISVPYSVNGAIHGVIGADINIENIRRDILDFETGVKDGYGMLFSADGQWICADVKESDAQKVTSADLLGGDEALSSLTAKDQGMFESKINGGEVFVSFDTVQTTGWKLAVIQPKEEIIAPAVKNARLNWYVAATILLFGVILFVIILRSVNRYSAKLSYPLEHMTEQIKQVGNGTLEYHSEIQTNDEVQTLSESFERMTLSLKDYIKNLTAVTAEKERIGAELDVAKNIQASMLPCIFPAFPERKEFDIHATMTPAKEVGGDFYDFFMVDETHLAIVMADVSGKGVPAALFMVIGKTLIKDHTQLNKNLNEVFNDVNDLLCEANSEGLFITAFEGVLDLETGEFTYVNAGHEMPFLYRAATGYQPEKIRPGFVLAGMEGMRYKSGVFQLNVGDRVFQYTDGVTEATDVDNQLYGMERLQAVLNRCADATPKETLETVKADIDRFVGDAPQFDDITMLCLEYKQKYGETNETEK